MFMWSATASESSEVSGPTSRRMRPRLSSSLVRSRGSSGRSSVSLRTSMMKIIVPASPRPRACQAGTEHRNCEWEQNLAAVPSQGRASATVVSAAPEAARLYEAYRRRVLGYCLTFLRNREEAEDAVQTTFLDAFRALERGVVPRVEDAWLLAVARNVCLARPGSGARALGRSQRGRRARLARRPDSSSGARTRADRAKARCGREPGARAHGERRRGARAGRRRGRRHRNPAR